METESAQLTFEAPDPAELAGILPGYEVQSLIAVGGMGAVYKAVQISLDRAVAIKILPRELGGDALFRAQFETEAKAMALLNHPNLAGVYDFGNVDGLLYIVMEFVEGESLYHYAYGKYLDPEDAIRFIRAICLGLHHAHEHGVLHRDIKPSNILLDFHGQPKVVDFGLAQGIRQVRGKDEEIFGTPHYTAPEVLRAYGVVDARADLFSVGVMLHELLTGRVPASDPRSASAIVQCDPRLDGVVRKSTHPNPDLRYSSCAEMATELDVITQTPAPRTLRTVDQRIMAGGTTRIPLGASPMSGKTALVPLAGAPITRSTVRMAGATLQVPGPTLQVPGPALQVPGPALQVPGPTLQVPGPALQVPGPALQAAKPTAGMMRMSTAPIRKPVLKSSSGSGIGFIIFILILAVGALVYFKFMS